MNIDQSRKRYIESVSFRNGMSIEHLKAGFYDNLFYSQGRYTRQASVMTIIWPGPHCPGPAYCIDGYTRLNATVKPRLEQSVTYRPNIC
jgi:hypothetical protein